MSEKRVPFIYNGRFGTVDETEAAAMPKGTRFLSPKEAASKEADLKQAEAEQAVNERYDAQPTIVKAAGLLGSGASLPVKAAEAYLGLPSSTPPTLDAFAAGGRQGLSAGLSDGLTRQALDAVGGKPAGDRYAAETKQQHEASPYAHGAGELVGTGAGAVTAPGAAAEGLVAKGLARAGVTGASVLGRAGASALKLGVRGGIEAGTAKLGSNIGDELLEDHDLTAEKMFAGVGTSALYGVGGGAVLGASGSLLKSGAGAARSALAATLTRPAAGAIAAGERAVAGAAQGLEGAATDLGAGAERMGVAAEDAVQTGRSTIGGAIEDARGTVSDTLRNVAADYGTEAGLKSKAYDKVWNAIGGGMGLQSTEFAKRAARYLPNGTRDVGEALVRNGVADLRSGWLDAAKNLKPGKMVPAIDGAIETVGQKLGAITGDSGGTVESRDVIDAIISVGKPYSESAATRPIAASIQKFGLELADSLGINSATSKVSVQNLLRERKALDLMVFENAALDPSITTHVKRELRGKLEGLIVDALDRDSGRLSGELAGEYKALKKDYVALNIARDVADDSAARIAKKATFGLSDLTAGQGSILKTVGYKLFKENGSAVAAAALFQEAENASVTRWLRKTDEQIGRAAKGLITPPAKGTYAGETMPAPKPVATTALARVAAFQSDPEGFLDHATSRTEALAAHSPEVAEGIVTRQVRAMAFLASKVPQMPDRDPLDPHPMPKMSPSEEASFARYAWYCDKPERFFSEVEHGRLVPEGAEVAQRLMPRAFAELQTLTGEALATQLARGNRLPFRQRELLGQLLDFAATPAQRPEHRAFLQQNVSDVLPSNQRIATAGPKGPRRISSQNGSALDRLEGKGPGRR